MKKKGPDSTEDDVEIVEKNEEPASDPLAADNAVAKLKEKLKQCLKERQEYLNGWQRAKADFINARKEEEKTRKEFVQFAKEDVLFQLLPVVDSFELAFANKDAWKKTDSNWREGIEHIYSQLMDMLGENGLSQVEPRGEVFDPNLHESVGSIPIKKKDEDGKIVEVVQKGYMLNGKVVRPARVKIGKFKNNS